MAKFIDSALLKTIGINQLLPIITKNYRKKLKIALIGEKCVPSFLQLELLKRYNVKITAFTCRNKFKIENGERFDILIGCRPCEADELILEAATKYKKLFILTPCTCNNPQHKIVNFIRKYPVITHIDAFPGKFENNNYDSKGWITLFNRKEIKE